MCLLYREAGACITGWEKTHWGSEKLGPVWCVALRHGPDGALIDTFVFSSELGTAGHN